MPRSTVLCVLSGEEPHDRALLAALSDRHVIPLEPAESALSHVVRMVQLCQEARPVAVVSAASTEATRFAAWLCGVPVVLEWSAGTSLAKLLDNLSNGLSGATAQAGLPLFIKRLFDLSVAAPALLASAPALLASAVAIRLSLGSPVFFRQERPGKRGKLFHIYKLRTMSNTRGPDGGLLPDEQRLAGVGKLIRRASLDELPQLLNVLLGQMSLVGPRPLLAQYLTRYSPRQARRHNVLPGITGLAQVNGRNAASWSERFEHDLEYVDDWSLALDAAILWKTLGAVLKGSGVSQAGHVTMPEFQGDPEAH